MFNQPKLPPESATVFCGGIRSPYRLNHPEGLLVDPLDGAIWCGGEAGELYRIEPDGSKATEIATSGGFALGLCMDSKRRIYMCDLQHQCVVVFDDRGNELKRLHGKDGNESLALPNYPALSSDERFLYVSDTRPDGPGIWRFDLHSGESILWMKEPCICANGLALHPDGSGIYLVESRLPGVSYVPIQPDGSAGRKVNLLSLSDDEPDGLAFAPDGTLWISIYNPSRIYRYHLDTAKLEKVIQDDSTDHIHHATNIAFRGESELFCANLGAWHITKIDLTALLAG
jgi:sugar lactone lactonase YvrE